jgi:hypothetical protein
MTPEELLADIAGLEARLAAIAKIADGFDEYMGDPDGSGGDHWGDCPLFATSPVDTPELYDHEPQGECGPDAGHDDDCEWHWNPEKAAKVCVCSVGALFKIARLAERGR